MIEKFVLKLYILSYKSDITRELNKISDALLGGAQTQANGFQYLGRYVLPLREYKNQSTGWGDHINQVKPQHRYVITSTSFFIETNVGENLSF
jgi:hypothetical protein